ncbi:Large-conductance mechanosensitive channel [compost metagenome]
MLKEFKAFIMRGNVVDLAVAVIMGAAFGAVVNSLVTDVITPAILNPVLEKAGAKDIAEWKLNGIALGKFIAAVINFIVVAFCIFMMIKLMNKASNLRKKQEAEAPAAPAEPSNEEKLLTEIRDLLKNK